MPSALLQNVLFEDIHNLSTGNKQASQYRYGDIDALYYDRLIEYIYFGYVVCNQIKYPNVGLFITTLYSKNTDNHITLKLCTNAKP